MIVVATDHDDVTSIVRRCMLGVPKLLSNLGYQVYACFDRDATEDGVYSAGLSAAVESGELLSLGVFAAHGSVDGLHDRHGRLLMKLDTCAHFQDAILVLCSCLKNGEFPAGAIKIERNGRKCIRAVICYEPKLKVLPRGFKRRKLKELEEQVLQGILETHVSLLTNSKTVGETVELVKEAWWNCPRQLAGGDIHIGMNWIKNRESLTWWGRPSARLSGVK